MLPNLSRPLLGLWVGLGLGEPLWTTELLPRELTEGEPRTKLENVLGLPPGLVGLAPSENPVGEGVEPEKPRGEGEEGPGGTLPVDKAGEGEAPKVKGVGEARAGEGVEPTENDEGN